MAKITTPRAWLLDETPMKMYCDNQVFTFAANNQTFHECTKHVEVDCQNQKGGGVIYGVFSTQCALIFWWNILIVNEFFVITDLCRALFCLFPS